VAKQTIFGRVTQLAKANVNALLDAAEDPQQLLDQLIRDYTSTIFEAEQAIAQTIGNLRMMAADQKEDLHAAEEWGKKAITASHKGDQLRRAGNTAEADKFDNLAKVALGKQVTEENEAKAADQALVTQRTVVEKLKTGLTQMKSKLEELKGKRGNLVARAQTAKAKSKLKTAVKSIDILDPASEVSRFEEKIRREEAKVHGAAKPASSALDAQFEGLEDLGTATEVDARLTALKTDAAIPAQAPSTDIAAPVSGS
jgi:phage shock protein A